MNSADSYVITPACTNCGKDENNNSDCGLSSCPDCKLVLCKECIWMCQVNEGTLLQCPFCDGEDKAAKQNREKRGLSRRFTWLATRFGQGIKAK